MARQAVYKEEPSEKARCAYIMTIIQGIQHKPLHHDYKQTKTLPVIMIQFSNQCDRCKMLKVVHGNQSDHHCNLSDTQLSIPQLYIGR